MPRESPHEQEIPIKLFVTTGGLSQGGFTLSITRELEWLALVKEGKATFPGVPEGYDRPGEF